MARPRAQPLTCASAQAHVQQGMRQQHLQSITEYVTGAAFEYGSVAAMLEWEQPFADVLTQHLHSVQAYLATVAFVAGALCARV